jgi:multidrug transporter EmrE-like cation transporter
MRLWPGSSTREMFSSIPRGVAAIAVLFLAAAAYLALVGLVILVSPGTVSMSLGAPLLTGLELSGPYMFLLTAGVGVLLGWGLLRLNNWVRRAAIAVAFIGVAMLVPSVSAAAVDLRVSLIWGGLGIIARVMILWYLYQEPVKAVFTKD